MLRNSMEDNQLDFNAPLMSVRRFTSSATSQMGDNRKLGRNPLKKISSHSSQNETVINSGSAVPFLWEQTPGNPKDGDRVSSGPSELPPVIPKLPPGRTVVFGRQQHYSSSLTDDKACEASHEIKSKRSSSNENTKPLERGCLEEQAETSSDEDSDDVFSDAPDTLSRSESFFMNCSLSGLTALDGLDLESNRSLSLDLEGRAFMMGRFLPAAKAIALETPQYASKKPAAAREPATPVNRFDGEKRTLTFQHRSAISPQKNPKENEDFDEDYDDTTNLSAKACRLRPRIMLNNYFLPLNPIPGMKGRMNSLPASRKLVPTKSKTGQGSLSEIDDEHTWEAVYKYKLAHGTQPHGVHEDGSRPTSESNQLTHWSDSQSPNGSSPYRRSASDAVSPYRNEAAQSLFQEGMGFLGIPKQVKTTIEDSLDTCSSGINTSRGILKSHHSSEHESLSSSSMVEKTLYMDSLQFVENSKSPSSSDRKEQTSPTFKDVVLLVGGENLEKGSLLAARPNVVERDALKLSQAFDQKPPSCSERSIFGASTGRTEGFCSDYHLYQENTLIKVNTDCDDLLPPKEDPKNSFSCSLKPILPPPLPKSPSESWLWRTLPSASSRNPLPASYLGIHFHPRRQVVKAPSTDPKWESIVKTSNLHSRNSRFSEELGKPLS